MAELDHDLANILSAYWKKKPEETPEYLRLKLLACLVQELREIRGTLSK